MEGGLLLGTREDMITLIGDHEGFGVFSVAGSAGLTNRFGIFSIIDCTRCRSARMFIWHISLGTRYKHKLE
jgi:hypothetical protein